MRHWWMAAVAALAMTGVGCSRSPEQAANPQNKTNIAASNTAADDAVKVVTQFLDALRRGGGDQNVATLLTQKAQQECQRTGLKIEPIGTPEAKFEVTRGTMVPGMQDAALVHSLWIEPGVDNAPQKAEIVWALKMEAGKWRISGMVAQGADGEPRAVDFENGNELLSHLTGQSPAAQTAAAPAANPPQR